MRKFLFQKGNMIQPRSCCIILNGDMQKDHDEKLITLSKKLNELIEQTQYIHDQIEEYTFKTDQLLNMSNRQELQLRELSVNLKNSFEGITIEKTKQNYDDMLSQIRKLQKTVTNLENSFINEINNLENQLQIIKQDFNQVLEVNNLTSINQKNELKKTEKRVSTTLLKKINEAKKELLLQESNTLKDYLNFKEQYAVSIWNLEGTTEKLIDFLEEWIFSDKNITADGMLIYLTCLLEKSELDLAAVGLRKYCQKYDTAEILNYLPMAWLAWKQKICIDNKFKRAAKVFESFERGRKENSLANYLKNKSFIVVGNSPSILGSQKGSEIDSKDIVFRMNTYKLSDEYLQDTGKRITAFVDNSNFATINHANHKNAKNLELIYLPYDLWHIKISQFCLAEPFINSYYTIVNKGLAKLSYLSPEDSIALKKELQIISPSSGMAIFWSIYRIFGYASPKWFIGFSDKIEADGIYDNPLKDKGDSSNQALQKANLDAYFEKDELTTFYKDAPIYSKGHGHNFNRELALRKAIIKKNNGEKK